MHLTIRQGRREEGGGGGGRIGGAFQSPSGREKKVVSQFGPVSSDLSRKRRKSVDTGGNCRAKSAMYRDFVRRILETFRKNCDFLEPFLDYLKRILGDFFWNYCI